MTALDVFSGIRGTSIGFVVDLFDVHPLELDAAREPSRDALIELRARNDRLMPRVKELPRPAVLAFEVEGEQFLEEVLGVLVGLCFVPAWLWLSLRGSCGVYVVLPRTSRRPRRNRRG